MPLNNGLCNPKIEFGLQLTGMCAGVGFAIGIDTVQRVVPQLIATGKVVRPALNIQACPTLRACTGIPCVSIKKIPTADSY